MFHENLTAQLSAWRTQSEEIILFIDVNENIYDGRFEHRLRDPDIRMVEQF